MDIDFIQSAFAHRIGGPAFGTKTQLYKFEKIKQAKREAQTANPDKILIDMGIGEPDGMPNPKVVAALNQATREPHNQSYADNGGATFCQAVSKYMHAQFGVTLDPEMEILHSIGSKAALSILPACFINPGDVSIMTRPGYPIFGTHAQYYGGEVHALPLLEENSFLPRLQDIPQGILDRAKVIVVNYPNNPTSACATQAFFEELVEFAHRHGLIVINDAAYASLTFGDKKLSLLQVPGAMDVCIELHSLSKSFNMTGWRLGWVCGNPQLIKAYGSVKDNTDSGQFLAIQEAGCTALNMPEITEGLVQKYHRRMENLVHALTSAGWPAKPSKGTFFVYVRAPKEAMGPKGLTYFNSAENFSQWLIKEMSISTVPWDDAGAFVRFSTTFDAPTEADEILVIKELAQRLGQYSYRF
ncbi:MAG: LL-diaminopimelate aminotransferase [Opitutales bacterium]